MLFFGQKRTVREGSYLSGCVSSCQLPLLYPSLVLGWQYKNWMSRHHCASRDSVAAHLGLDAPGKEASLSLIPDPLSSLLQLCALQEDAGLGSVYAVCSHHRNDVIYLSVT